MLMTLFYISLPELIKTIEGVLGDHSGNEISIN